MGYFVAALGLVVVLLPSVLRPPQQPPTQTAELSPDAPADEDQQSIISALNRGQSGTVGGELPGELDTSPAHTLPIAPAKRQILGCPRGFGTPPRQWQSVYAPPCVPVFKGDNGGATWHNVTGDLVRVGVRHLVHTCTESGPIPFHQDPSESACGRTLRVLQSFFNTTYELYGRQIQFVSLPATADFNAPSAQQQAAAEQADNEYKVFAATTIGYKFNEELNRRGLVTFGMPSSRHRYVTNAPHQWSFMPDLTLDDEVGAELVCKALRGKPANHAGNPDLQVQVRKLGVIAWTTTAGGGRGIAGVRRRLPAVLRRRRRRPDRPRRLERQPGGLRRGHRPHAQ